MVGIFVTFFSITQRDRAFFNITLTFMTKCTVIICFHVYNLLRILLNYHAIGEVCDPHGVPPVSSTKDVMLSPLVSRLTNKTTRLIVTKLGIDVEHGPEQPLKFSRSRSHSENKRITLPSVVFSFVENTTWTMS